MSKPSKTKQLRCGMQGVVQWLVAVDYVLRPGGELATDKSIPQLRLRQIALTVVVFGPLYGIAMGSYAMVSGEHSLWQQLPQMIYSGIKVPLLLAVTVAISLPSFFVINTLFGLRDDFREVLRAILSAQSGMVVILASLLPLTVFFYVCVDPNSSGYQAAVLVNALMFGIASIASQILLGVYYRPLSRANPRHGSMMKVWIFVYAFVGIQAGYCLRPFIGSPEKEISFFRNEPFENAYVKVWSMACEVFADWISM